MKTKRNWLPALTTIGILGSVLWAGPPMKYDPTRANLSLIAEMKVGAHDWPQWGGTGMRNNTPLGRNIPTEWDVQEGMNIKWKSRVGSQTYGTPVIANGKVYVCTNNGAGLLERYPNIVDLGCLLCFDEKTGKFLWQYSSEKLPSGHVHDWPDQGICCAPLADGQRIWFVSNRGEVVCLDSEGFGDGQNDGPYQNEPNENENEADVVWVLDMMDELGISQHNMCACSVTQGNGILFVNTSNGVDEETHINIPAPNAPSLLALDPQTGKVLWSDNSPGTNILHGQWSSPAYAVLGGVPQVLFAGGDGWLYSFRAEKTKDAKAELLWKFDTNPKESKWGPHGRGTRNNLIAIPAVHDGLVYISGGQDPEHGDGSGHLWCIDPTKRGDVSPELAYDKDGNELIPPNRFQAVNPVRGEYAKPNPNSAMVWHFGQHDANGNGRIDFEEEIHRTCSTVAIKNHLLFIPDFSGIFHCFDAKTGKHYWTDDLLAACWGSPLIVEDKVYIGDEDGDLRIYRLSQKLEKINEMFMDDSIYTTAVVANDVLFISTRTHLFAIENPKE